MNVVILKGNLGKDPELRKTTSGKSVCNFSLATTYGYAEKKETTWHNIVLWDKQAENATKYVGKGSSVLVQGRVSNRQYEDKEGVTKYITEIQCHQCDFLDKRENSETAQTPKVDF